MSILVRPPYRTHFSNGRTSSSSSSGEPVSPLKGVHTAAEVLADLRRRGIDAQSTVLGAGSEGLHEEGEQLRKKDGILLKLKPFTSDRSVIETELRGADLMMMSSKHDGFGPAATEEAGSGVPVLIPSNIGAGMFFNDKNRIPPEIGSSSVIQVPLSKTIELAGKWQSERGGGSSRREAVFPLHEFIPGIRKGKKKMRRM